MAPAGVATVKVNEDGRTWGSQAFVLTEGKVLGSLRFPLVVGGFFSRRELEVVVTFDPPVKPETQT